MLFLLRVVCHDHSCVLVYKQSCDDVLLFGSKPVFIQQYAGVISPARTWNLFLIRQHTQTNTVAYAVAANSAE